MSAPEFGQRAAHGAEKTPKPSQKCREISSSEISTNNSAASAVVVQTFPRSSPLCFLLSGRHSVRPKARTFSQLVNSTSCAGSVGPPVIHMMKRIMALSYHG